MPAKQYNFAKLIIARNAMAKKALLGFAIVAAAAAGAAGLIYLKKLPPESAVFINGKILTMDNNDSIVEAVAIKRDKIIAAGSNEEIKKFITGKTVVTDLEGKTMLPGFVDAHSHFPTSGLIPDIGVDVNSPPIGDIENIPQLIEALKKKAAKTKKGEKVFGLGYDDTKLAERRHPDRHDLDKVSTEHPVFVLHISGHYAAANTRALEMLGVDKNTKDPEGGSFHRDPETGEPDGVIEETAVEIALEKGAQFSLQQKLTIIRAGSKDYAAAGVTTAQNGLAQSDLIAPMAYLSKLGFIPLRLIVWPDKKTAEKILDKSLNVSSLNSDMFSVGAVKLFADGSIQAYTGYLTKPYYKQREGETDYRGYPVQSREELTATVTKFNGADMQIAIHGNGDAAIDDIIYAMRQAQNAHHRDDPRLILIHGQTTRPDQLDAMKELGITPSFHAVHPYYWGDRHRDIFLGPERTEHISPLKTALDKGVRFSTHLDTPVVPMNPLLLVWTAVNRLSSDGNLIGAAEAITPMQALRSVTIDAAWQVFQEQNRGSIEKGKFADFAIISGDPLEEPAKINDMKVLKTIVGGRTVFEAGKN